MSNNPIIRELKLHSPAGVEPAIFTWPSADQQVKEAPHVLLFVIQLNLEDQERFSFHRW